MQLVYARMLLDGLLTTIELGLLTIIFGSLAGALLGAARVSAPWWAQRAIAAYVEVVRSIPVLVLLFVGYYGLPILFGLDSLSPFASAVIIMALYQAAYTCEVVRGGIEAVPRGQWEAARALAMSYPRAMRQVIGPQALRIILPPFVLQCIGTFKDTSVASVIGLVDLTNNALVIRGNTGANWDVFALLALLYFGVCMSVAAIGSAVEKRFDRGFGFLSAGPAAAASAQIAADIEVALVR